MFIYFGSLWWHTRTDWKRFGMLEVGIQGRHVKERILKRNFTLQALILYFFSLQLVGW